MPIARIAGDVETAGAWIVLDLDVSGDGSFERMADVVHDKAVTVVPSTHVELLEGGPVVGPVRLVKENVAVVLIGAHDADCILQRVEGKGLEQQALPVIGLALHKDCAPRMKVGLWFCCEEPIAYVEPRRDEFFAHPFGRSRLNLQRAGCIGQFTAISRVRFGGIGV